MVLSPLIFYVLGILFLILSLEDDQSITSSAVYIGIGIFINLIAYYTSYNDADYVSLAYFPLAMIAILILLLFQLAFRSFPKGIWGDTEEDEFGHRDTEMGD